jgi:PiT family inorganic phosphate transporter
MIDLDVVTAAVIFGGLVGTIVWDLITWYVGLPTSSSHALAGGYAGAAVAKAGFGSLITSGSINTLTFIVLAPMMGMPLGLILVDRVALDVPRILSPPRDTWFRRLQLRDIDDPRLRGDCRRRLLAPDAG